MTALRSGLLLVGFLLGSPGVYADDVKSFYSIVSPNGADPWVIRHDGVYYMTASTNIDVTLWRSASLTGIGGGEKKIIWTPPKTGLTSQNIWAPEIHRLDGKWYIYVAADDGKNENHRMYVLENASADPFQGEFVMKGKIADPKNDKWAIDGTIMTWKDKNYFAWSGWVGDTNVRQELYIAPMSNPLTLAGPRVEISRPTLPWEKIGDPNVNEGPQVLVRNNSVHLIYSASGSWTNDYCIGRLTMNADRDPLDPQSWVKHPEPVFRSTFGVHSPGHCSFVKSPDGKEDWLVYHTARHKSAGWSRNIRMQPFTWNADDSPHFDSPVSPNQPIALPSGETQRLRFEAEDAKRLGEAFVVKREGASRSITVMNLESAESGVEFAVDVKQSGKYLLAVRHANESRTKSKVANSLWVNGTETNKLDFEYTAGNWAVAAIHYELKVGTNTVRLAGKLPGVLIDCLDVAGSEKGK